MKKGTLLAFGTCAFLLVLMGAGCNDDSDVSADDVNISEEGGDITEAPAVKGATETNDDSNDEEDISDKPDGKGGLY